MTPEDLLYRRRVTAPRQPMDERLPDGRSVAELLAGIPALAGPAANRQPTSLAELGPPPPVPRLVAPGEPPPAPTFTPRGPLPGGPVTPGPPPTVHMGVDVSRNASALQRLMAERQALSTADPSSKVRRTDWGYEQLPPEQSPSRLRSLGTGAATGAMLAGQATKGDPWGTLAGTVVGALTGGVSPQLMQAFQRRQELDRNAGELNTEQQLQLGNAQLYNAEVQPELNALRIQRQLDEDARREAERVRRDADRDADRKTRSEQAAEANKARQAQLTETQKRTEEIARHNKAVESKPSGTNERVVNGAIYRKDDAGVWRQAPGSPPPLPSGTEVRIAEITADRTAKGKQAAALYQKGSEYWDQAKAKRAEADRLSKGDDGQPSRIRAVQNEDAIKRLVREAEGLENKTREVQIQGDKLAAESEATGNSQPAAPTGKAFNLGAWKRDHPGQDPSGVIQRAKDAKMRIIE